MLRYWLHGLSRFDAIYEPQVFVLYTKLVAEVDLQPDDRACAAAVATYRRPSGSDTAPPHPPFARSARAGEGNSGAPHTRLRPN